MIGSPHARLRAGIFAGFLFYWLVWCLALPYAVANGVAEEVLWRGTFVSAFPSDRLRGFLYPALAFAAWHVSPTSVLGSTLQLVLGGAFIGLAYGWVAWRTRSIRLTTIFHVLTDFTGLIGVFYLA